MLTEGSLNCSTNCKVRRLDNTNSVSNEVYTHTHTQSTEGMISLYTSSNEVYSNRKLVVIEEAKIWREVTFIPICGTVSNEPV